MSAPVHLPPFPVDEGTLSLLLAAMFPREYGDPDAESSSVGNFLRFMSEMGGSDTQAVADVVDDGSHGGPVVHVMRDPEYHEHAVMEALVLEIRRLRALVDPSAREPR